MSAKQTRYAPKQLVTRWQLEYLFCPAASLDKNLQVNAILGNIADMLLLLIQTAVMVTRKLQTEKNNSFIFWH